MADDDFARVEEGLIPWPACSPAIEDDFAFRGIRIAAPARVVLPAGGGAPRVMICGGYQLPVDYAGLGMSLERGVWLVACDLEHGHLVVAPAVSELGQPAADEPAPVSSEVPTVEAMV